MHTVCVTLCHLLFLYFATLFMFHYDVGLPVHSCVEVIYINHISIACIVTIKNFHRIKVVALAIMNIVLFTIWYLCLLAVRLDILEYSPVASDMAVAKHSISCLAYGLVYRAGWWLLISACLLLWTGHHHQYTIDQWHLETIRFFSCESNIYVHACIW